MSSSVRSAESWTEAASDFENPAVRAGTYSINVGDDRLTGWHSHDLHQLEFALEGIAEVETGTARYLLPPQQAVWIPAGVEHCSTLRRVRSVSVFFDPAMGLPAGDRVRMLGTAPVIREMMRYALRWPISRTSSEPMANSFFDTLGYLVVEWLENETPLSLPTARDPVVAAAMTYTNEHLSDLTMSGVCAAVGTSERSLRRGFIADTGNPWRHYVRASRLLKAMALLADDDLNILGVALAVGFRGLSAFTRAFTDFTGEPPSAYRRRIRSGAVTMPLIQPPARDPADPIDPVVLRWSHLRDE